MRNIQLRLFICVLFVISLCACSKAQVESRKKIPDAKSFQETLVVNIPEPNNTEIKQDVIMKAELDNSIEKDSQTKSDNQTEAYTQAETGKRVTEIKMIQTAKRDCLDCDGIGKVPCPPCGQTGRVQCQQCEGIGCALCCRNGLRECVCDTNSDCSSCDGQGKLDCITCSGSGMIPCETCNSSNTGSAQGVTSSDNKPTKREDFTDGDIHLCPDCEGEGRTGICTNCDGEGYDIKTQQICINCLTTGKNRCDRCEGYGMLDNNGNGVGINNPNVGNQSRFGDLYSSQNGTNRQRCPEADCEGGRRKCDVCDGGGLVKRIKTSPYYGGYKKKAVTTFEKCVACQGGYVDCLRCIDGWIYN